MCVHINDATRFESAGAGGLFCVDFFRVDLLCFSFLGRIFENNSRHYPYQQPTQTFVKTHVHLEQNKFDVATVNQRLRVSAQMLPSSCLSYLSLVMLRVLKSLLLQGMD